MGARMALDTQQQIVTYDAPKKDLYELGEMPPLGHVPKQMYAWAIRRERHGEPDKAFQVEVVDTWAIDSHEVLVLVMAAGVNYNGVWAGLGQPISPFDGHKQPYHIAGSDAAGIVWAVGDKVTRWKVGDEVIIHCNQGLSRSTSLALVILATSGALPSASYAEARAAYEALDPRYAPGEGVRLFLERHWAEVCGVYDVDTPMTA